MDEDVLCPPCGEEVVTMIFVWPDEGVSAWSLIIIERSRFSLDAVAEEIRLWREGRAGEMVVFPRIVTDSERDLLEVHFRKRWDISSKLVTCLPNFRTRKEAREVKEGL